MKPLYKICLLVLAITLVSPTFSQYITKTTGGNWNAASTWTGGSSPADWANNTATVRGNVTSPGSISGFSSITINNGATLSSNALSLTSINTLNITNGSININGDLSIYGTTTINISSGSSINVSGKLSVYYGSTINVSSGATITAGSFSTSDNADAILNNSGTVTISGNVTEGGVLNNYGVFNVGGNFTGTGSWSSTTSNYGNMHITGDVSLPSSSKFYAHPGSQAIIDGNTTVDGNENLVVGTNVAPPPYADVVIRKNLNMSGSGDVTINRNGRFAVFGNIAGGGNGGTLFTVNNGGQAYVDGNISFIGGGDAITNNNSTNPFGLYVRGAVSNTGGGSTTTTNKGDEMTMYNTNLPFYNWVNSFQTILPVTLTYFQAEYKDEAVTLYWTTVSETDFDKFIIERSEDGHTFSQVGEAKGAGEISKNELHYQFEDDEPLYGKSYYRLKIVDLDESFEYSNLVYVNVTITDDAQVGLYPNPVVNHQFTITFPSRLQQPASLQVVSSTGKVVMNTSIGDEVNSIELPGTLPIGIYFVKVSTSKSTEIIRVAVK